MQTAMMHRRYATFRRVVLMLVSKCCVIFLYLDYCSDRPENHTVKLSKIYSDVASRRLLEFQDFPKGPSVFTAQESLKAHHSHLKNLNTLVDQRTQQEWWSPSTSPFVRYKYLNGADAAFWKKPTTICTYDFGDEDKPDLQR
jgi:hypothetical protein